MREVVRFLSLFTQARRTPTFYEVRVPPLAKRFLRIVQMGERKFTHLGDVLRRDVPL